MAKSIDLSNGLTLDTALNSEDIHPSKLRIVKNLVIVSISWWLLYSAYDGLVMFQSTLNSDGGIGVISVSVQYACGCLTALFFPKYLVRKLGCKVVIAACMVCHAPYIAANFYPHWVVMIPSSILLGAANPLLWAALCTYLNNLSTLYMDHMKNSSESHKEIILDSAHSSFRYKFSERPSVPRPSNTQNEHDNSDRSNNFSENQSHKDISSQKYVFKILEATTARFFGFHGMIYNLSHITSNIMAYYVLRIGIVGAGYVKHSTCNCGPDFCNDQIACFDGNLKPPNDETRIIMTSICVALVVLSIVIMVLFLDDLGRKREAVSLSLEILMATFKLMKRLNIILIIPMTLYIGALQGFIMGDYTQAYVGCAWGIPNVGLVMAFFGLFLVLSCTVSGWLVKYVERSLIFLLVGAVTIATGVLLLLWRPDADDPALMFVVGGCLGIMFGSYWSQLRAFYGIVFKKDEEAAFGTYQLWHSVGVCIAFGYSKYFCTSIKIYILLFFFALGISGYLIVERSHSKSKQCSK